MFEGGVSKVHEDIGGRRGEVVLGGCEGEATIISAGHGLEGDEAGKRSSNVERCGEVWKVVLRGGKCDRVGGEGESQQARSLDFPTFWARGIET